MWSAVITHCRYRCTQGMLAATTTKGCRPKLFGKDCAQGWMVLPFMCRHIDGKRAVGPADS